MSFYDRWVDEQAAHVEAEMRKLGSRGIYTAAIYVIPSNGATPGRLVVSCQQVPEAHSVVRFPAQGSNVMNVPYPHLRHLLWHNCRNIPILPTQGEVA